MSALMSPAPCVPMSYVSFETFLRCLPASANVLICCLVQPDGPLPPPPHPSQQWEKMGKSGEGGRKGSYLQRSPLIKNPSVEITPPGPPQPVSPSSFP